MNTTTRTIIITIAASVFTFIIYLMNQRAINRFVGESAQALRYGAGLAFAALGIALVCAAFGLVIVVLHSLYHRELTKREEAKNRSHDGDFRLQQVNTKQGTTIINPNMLAGGWVAVGNNGDVRTPQYEPHQLPMHQARAAVSMAQAMTPGDEVYIEAARQGGMPPNMYKPAAPSSRQLKQPRIIGDMNAEPVQIGTPSIITPTNQIEMIRKATPTHIPLGAKKDGEVIYWDMTMDPHLRYHGKSRYAGKTNVMRLSALGAYAAQQEVWVFDRRMFKHWKAFDGKARFVNSLDGEEFIHALDDLYKIYLERDRQLSDIGAEKISEAPHLGPHIVACIDEFGAACQEAKAKGYEAELDARIDWIMREGGSSGVHLVLGDQFVDNSFWLKSARVNAQPICGYVPQDAEALCGYYGANKLDKHEFAHHKQIFKSWDARPAEAAILGYTAPKQIEVTPTPRQPNLKDKARDWMEANRDSLQQPGAQTRMKEEIGASKGHASDIWNALIGEYSTVITSNQAAQALLQENGFIDKSQ